jgi:hypothetical protein
MLLTRTIGLAAAGLLMACNPTFNWRTVRADGAPLQALMPCKPDAASRQVPLGGVPTALQMRSCDAGGLTFAVAWADVGEAARVEPALRGWQQATLVAVRADAASGAEPRPQVRVSGADRAEALSARGLDHRGEPIEVRAVHVVRGTHLHQAAIYGPSIDDDVARTFFEGLQVQ